ncbi:G2H3 [Mytilus edulis]|uniref:G2H3 n=1 Tax=Mytilus edulis TaxID=6550 RepID=A0A8S3TB28_MYTED|nr:G2H3 [Mytilus edulis]
MDCSSGKGRKKSKLALSWSADELKDFIVSQFPALRGHAYEMLYSMSGGVLKKFPEEINTPDRMKVFLTNIRRTPGTLFIRPIEFLVLAGPVQVCTAQVSLYVRLMSTRSDVTLMIKIEEKEQKRGGISDNDDLEIEEDQDSIPEGRSTVEQEDIFKLDKEDLPKIEIPTRRRRRAAEVAISNIHGWCGNRGAENTELNPVSSTRPLINGAENTELNPVSSTRPLINGNIVDNQGLSITEVRALQDKEYLASLTADRKKDEDRRIGDERILQKQNDGIELEELIKRRKQDLQVEPGTGFIIKLRTGERRRFRRTDSVQELVNFVGSHSFSTKGFEISVAGTDRKINSWTSQGQLMEYGICHSAVAEVLWNVDKPSTLMPIIRTYEDLMASTYDSDDYEMYDIAANNEQNQDDIAVNYEQNQVEFRNECGEDEGGLRREYLEILLRQMIKSSYFEEIGSNGQELTFNMLAFIEGTYKTIGKMLATIIIQGGAFSPILTHAMIQNEPVDQLNTDDEVLTAMEESGITSRLSPTSRLSIAKALIAHFSRITSKKGILDQCWEGAEELGLQSLLKSNPGTIRRILCKCCGKTQQLTADHLIDMIKIKSFGDRGSNNRQLSEDVAQQFESFVFDCQDGKCQYEDGSVKTEDVLQFITGCSSIPPGGFDSNFTIHFTNDKCYPTVSTCSFDITLPLHLGITTNSKRL